MFDLYQLSAPKEFQNIKIYTRSIYSAFTITPKTNIYYLQPAYDTNLKALCKVQGLHRACGSQNFQDPTPERSHVLHRGILFKKFYWTANPIAPLQSFVIGKVPETQPRPSSISCLNALFVPFATTIQSTVNAIGRNWKSADTIPWRRRVRSKRWRTRNEFKERV